MKIYFLDNINPRPVSNKVHIFLDHANKQQKTVEFFPNCQNLENLFNEKSCRSVQKSKSKKIQTWSAQSGRLVI